LSYGSKGEEMNTQKGSKVESGGLEEDYNSAKKLLAEANQLIQDADKAKAEAAALRREAASAQRYASHVLPSLG
jgi:hypothetical protein